MQLPIDILHCIADVLDHESLLRLSVVNKALNAVSSRLIFQAIRISGSWQAVESDVDLILEKCAEFCDLVQSFTFRVVFVDHFCMDGAKPDRGEPQHEFPSRFCTLITKFRRLKELEFRVPEPYVDCFAAEFASRSLTLPTITSITVGPFCHFLVTHCPGVMNVATSGAIWLHTKRGWVTREHSFALIQALAGRPIRKFAMYEMWSTALLEG
ncbi:hypothetical protein BD410DRAFT_602041 [Rickenella mellea]|uniref:F-box domain-containing protein n=1 Tax=Rickenella mellea TaxID=50990 RepID=A0A4Y7QEV5_9AGAM|nr:hypothetical protein BD410DRAFT_602041 [Rickenella mellea]